MQMSSFVVVDINSNIFSTVLSLRGHEIMIRRRGITRRRRGAGSTPGIPGRGTPAAPGVVASAPASGLLMGRIRVVIIGLMTPTGETAVVRGGLLWSRGQSAVIAVPAVGRCGRRVLMLLLLLLLLLLLCFLMMVMLVSGSGVEGFVSVIGVVAVGGIILPRARTG